MKILDGIFKLLVIIVILYAGLLEGYRLECSKYNAFSGAIVSMEVGMQVKCVARANGTDYFIDLNKAREKYEQKIQNSDTSGL